MVLQGLAGHLHGQVLQPRLCGVGQVPLEVQGLRGGQVGLKALHPVVGVDGGDDPRLPLALAGAIHVQHRLQVVGGRGLALGAGEADYLQLARGVVIAQIGHKGHGRGESGQRLSLA